MSNNICLPKIHLLIILCVFIGLSAWYIHFNKDKQPEYQQALLNQLMYQQLNQQLNQLNQPINQQLNQLNQPINQQLNQLNQPINQQIDDSFIEKRQILEIRDAEVKYNDFKPPERRVPEYLYPTTNVKQLINIPTRGYPDNYQLMGVLLRENTETAFNLFGRQKYSGSDQYEYYAQGTMHNNTVKLPIHHKKELYDGDEVKIPGTNEENGKFKVKLYKFDVPRYDPFEY